MQAKPGFKSTEFYLSGGVGVQMVESGLLEDPDPFVRGIAVLAMAATAIVYAYLRHLAKAPQAALPARPDSSNEDES